MTNKGKTKTLVVGLAAGYAALGVIALLPGTERSQFADTHPRMVNQFVTQDNISQNICVSGWTKTVRPPVSYTSYLKTEELHFENNDQGVVSDYELDHRIPLELGGNPYRTENLWMEPHTKSEHSDPLENSLKRQVCAGTLTLNDARWKIYLYKRSE